MVGYEGASFFDAGGGDIGLEDSRNDVAGAPVVFYNLDGSPITFESAQGFNRGSAKSPSWGSSHSVRCRVGGTVVAQDWASCARCSTPPAAGPARPTSGSAT